MADFISQRDVPSFTPSALQRTAYLAPFTDDVRAAIRGYLSDEPDGEEVTLAVLHRVGPERLIELAPRRDLDQGKKDMGLFVAQQLVEEFGAGRVLTLRGPDGRSASTRRNPWPELDWVSRYTKHRVLRVDSAEPIVLDTCTVRDRLHGTPGALDLAELGKFRGRHPIMLADNAYAELVAQLDRGAISAEAWSEFVVHLDHVLDPDCPLAPGGKDRAALSGALPHDSFDLESLKAHARIAWGFLRSVRRREDLAGNEFRGPDGRRFRLRQAAGPSAHSALVQAGAGWTGFIMQMGKIVAGIKGITEDDICNLIATNLSVDMPTSTLSRLDLPLRVIANRSMQAARGRTPYKGTQQDGVDFDLLFAVGMPAYVCTADKNLHKLARSSGAADRERIMLPAELMAWLGQERFS